jgi:hypothetical protein
VRRRPRGRAGAVVDRRPDQRMPEHHRRPVEAHQVGELLGLQHRRVQAQPPGGAADGGELAGALGRGQQQQRLGVGVVPADAVQERPLQLPGQRQRLLQRLGAGPLPRGERGRQLQQRQRVAAGLLQQAAADRGGEPAGPALLQQRRGGVGVQAGKAQLAHPGRVHRAPLAAPQRDQQRDRLGLQPARGERQRRKRRRVRPVGVVDQAQQRPFLGVLRQQRERGHRHQEPVGGLARLQPERDPQRARLRRRQPLGLAEQRAQELVQRRVRQP